MPVKEQPAPTNFTVEMDAEEFRSVLKLKSNATAGSKSASDYIINKYYYVPLAKAFDGVNKVTHFFLTS